MKYTGHSDQAKLCLAVGRPNVQRQTGAEVLGTAPITYSYAGNVRCLMPRLEQLAEQRVNTAVQLSLFDMLRLDTGQQQPQNNLRRCGGFTYDVMLLRSSE